MVCSSFTSNKANMTPTKRVLCLLFLVFAALPLYAQFSSTASHIRYGASLPTKCSPLTGDVFFKTSATIATYYCSATNIWSLATGVALPYTVTFAGQTSQTISAATHGFTSKAIFAVCYDTTVTPAAPYKNMPVSVDPVTFAVTISPGAAFTGWCDLRGPISSGAVGLGANNFTGIQAMPALSVGTRNLTVLAIGTSITVGFGITSSAYDTPSCISSLTNAACNDWLSQAILMNGLSGRVAIKNNQGVSGTQMDQILTAYNTNGTPISPRITGNSGLIFFEGGANDYPAQTLATMKTRWSAIISQLKTDGWVIAVATTMARTGSNNTTQVKETRRVAFNEWVRAQTSSYDYLIDWDKLLQDPYDISMFSDGSHPTAAGAYQIARLINAAIWTKGATVGASTIGLTVPAETSNMRLNHAALSAITSGDNNSAAGAQALGVLTTGSGNTAFGASALPTEISGSRNTAFGYLALNAENGANDNTAVGWGALFNVVSGGSNTAIGSNALVNATAATTGNTAVGNSTGGATAGNNNTFIGNQAGSSVPGGNTIAGNVAIGYQAGFTLGGAANGNVIIGPSSGGNITGNANVCIGNGACGGGDTMAGGSNFALGNGARVTGAAGSAVQIGVGTNSTSNTLQFQSVRLADANGYLYSNTSTPATSIVTCTQGAIWADANFVYACTATNNIKRAALSAF
jgi:lysophospholipase L1-like esterase